MALQVEVGSFVVKVGTGAQNVPLIDSTFQPKGFILYSTKLNAAEDAAGTFHMGFDDGVHHFGKSIGTSNFGNAFDDPLQVWADNQSMLSNKIAFAFEIHLAGHITSINVGSFDIQWDLNTGMEGMIWFYKAIGGDGIESIIGGQSTTGAPSSYDVNLPFDPIVMFGMYHPGVTGGTFSAIGGASSIAFGWATKCNNQQCCLTCSMQGTSNPPNTSSYQNLGNFLAITSPDSGSVPGLLNIVSFGTQKVTISQSFATGPTYFSYFALGGLIAANVGTFIQGATSIIIPAISPKSAMFASHNMIGSPNVLANAYASLGATDKVRQKAIWMGDKDGASMPGNISCRNDNSNCILLVDPLFDTGQTVTGLATAALNGTVINPTWSIDDAGNRELFYIVLADKISDADFCGSQSGNPGAGIYKMVVGRTNDRLFIP